MPPPKRSAEPDVRTRPTLRLQSCLDEKRTSRFSPFCSPAPASLMRKIDPKRRRRSSKRLSNGLRTNSARRLSSRMPSTSSPTRNGGGTKRWRRPRHTAPFFRAFWARRDPTPARAVNVRLAEHYRRLLRAEKDYVSDGFRDWHTDPDRMGELRLPETHGLGALFNDRGLVYLRHGEPDDRVVTVGGANTPPTISWRYYDPAMDFHFLTAGTDNDWRLTPRLPQSAEVFDDREYWGRYLRGPRPAHRPQPPTRRPRSGSTGV